MTILSVIPAKEGIQNGKVKAWIPDSVIRE